MLRGRTGIYFLIACAIVLRLISFHYNQNLHGDLNNLVLVTESVGKSLSFSLPYRYNQYMSNPVPPDASYKEPYAQHQPLWMILGGLIHRHMRSIDAFVILKALSLIAGMILLILMGRLARGDFKFHVCFLLSCFSIALIDFSANGSFYIMCTLLYFGFFVSIIRSTSSERGSGWAAFAGLLGLLALLTHLISLALVGSAAFLYVRGRSRLRTAALISGGIMLVMLLAYELWKRSFFDLPPSTSLIHFFLRNGLADQTVDENSLSLAVTYGVSPSSALAILRNALSGLKDFMSTLLVLCGPLIFFLVIGAYRLITRRDNDAFGICLAVLAGHVCVLLLFPFNRFRFIIPVVPLIFFVVGAGIEAFREKPDSRLLRRFRLTGDRVIVLSFALFIGYNLFSLARYPHTFYDKSRAGTVRTYGEMKDTVRWLRENVDCGTVLGYSRVLDGGVETYYYHRWPFVAGRKFIPYPDLLPRLIEEYDIEYIWTEKEVWDANDRLKAFPILHQNGRFLILLSGSPREDDGPLHQGG